MALNQEEIRIKMGIDTKAVIDGLSGVSGYLDRWKAKRKTSEDEYTSWWGSTLKERSDLELRSEVEAATRRNRARALWRERAAARELKIAQAQAAKEKALSDMAAAQQAASRSAITIKTMQALGSKAMSLLKANVYMAAAQIATEIIPTWDAFWSKVYGTDPETMQKRQEANESIRDLASRVADSRKSADKATKDERLRNATAKERLEIANRELKAEEEKAAANADALEFYQREGDALKAKLAQLREISRETEIQANAFGVTGANVTRPTQRAMQAAAEAGEIERLLGLNLETVGERRVSGNQSRERLAELRGARDAAIKDVAGNYLRFADQDLYGASPQARGPETTAEYLERGMAKGYLAVGMQSAKERYAARKRMFGMGGALPTPPSPPVPEPPKIIDVRIVDVFTK